MAQTKIRKEMLDIGGTYVDRGDVADADFDIDDLTTDFTWNDLDLSSIIPSGATAVYLRVLMEDDQASSVLNFRKNGNTNVWNSPTTRTPAANVSGDSAFVVPVDSNGVIEYRGTNRTFTFIYIVVMGWYI